MAIGAVIQVDNQFADGTKRSVNIGEINVNNINGEHIKEQIALINDPTLREQHYPGFTTGLVSNAGANFVSISGARIIVEQKTILW